MAHHKIKFAVDGIQNHIPSMTKEHLNTTTDKFSRIIMIFIILIIINNTNNMNIILTILLVILIILII